MQWSGTQPASLPQSREQYLLPYNNVQTYDAAGDKWNDEPKKTMGNVPTGINNIYNYKM